MSRWPRLSLGLIWALLVACRGRETGGAPGRAQWVFSREDRMLLSAARERNPAIGAGIWIGSLVRKGDGVGTQLGVQPEPGDTAAVWVIRLEDTLHPLVDSLPGDSLASLVAARVQALLDVAEQGGPRHTVQLDYDAPVRLLEQWAQLVRTMRQTVLQEREVWVTSILAHVEHPQYGEWFRGVADGHVLQLFDTGLPFTSWAPRRVEEAIRRANLPVSIGLGAFERQLSSGTTEHRAWFAWAEQRAHILGVQDLWIFPAGQPYLPLLSSVDR